MTEPLRPWERRRPAALLGVAALIAGISLGAASVRIAAPRAERPPAVAYVEPLDLPPLRAVAERSPARRHARHRPRPVAAPVRIAIGAIALRARIVPVGLDRNRTLRVPAGLGVAGWWSGGARPGQRGPAVVVGHVDSKTGPAVFFRIGALRRGAVVRIVRRDRSVARFAVQRVARYPKARFPTRDVYGPTPGPALRLVTCSGDFNHRSGHYADNTVVYATLLGGP